MVLSGGSPTDNNAVLFRAGQMEGLQPYIDSGIIKVVADQWVDNWDATKAEQMMENILTAQGNKIDAVVASNDGTALGELQAMKAQGVSVPISGQDATADGCNSIVLGGLTVTVFKDTRLLAPKAVSLIEALVTNKPLDSFGLKSSTLAELTNDKTKTGNVQSLFLPVVEVTKDNVYDVVVKSGFQTYDNVYRNVPTAQLPKKP
jgi:D-xylose transport system substrate-binding protein